MPASRHRARIPVSMVLRRFVPYALGLAFLGYYGAVAGTALGDFTSNRIVGAIAGGWFIWRYFSRQQDHSDELEAWLVAALVAFAFAGIFAQFRRQALDVIVTAMAYLAALDFARVALANRRSRTVIITAMQAACLAVGVTVALAWLATAFLYVRATGFQAWPPWIWHFPPGIGATATI